MKRPRRKGSRKAKLRRRTRRLYQQRGGAQVPTFHVLIATAGRPSLKKMIDSLKPQLQSGDALTIVFDGSHGPAMAGFTKSWVEGFDCSVNVKVEEPALGAWGHGIRNKYTGLLLAPRTTFIMHADDDDIYLKGAFDHLRAMCIDPKTLYITKMVYAQNPRVVIPRQSHSITVDDIGTPNGIIPWEASHKSIWLHQYRGDFAYYAGLVTHVSSVKFLPLIIYLVGAKVRAN